MTRAPVKPELVRWARERSGIPTENLIKRFANLPKWESGEALPTLKQAKDFAKAVYVPIGYLFLSEPPIETISIPDFRTLDGQKIERLGPDLLDTIYTCQMRQDWYRDFARTERLPILEFVDSTTVKERPETIAAKIRKTLEFDPVSYQNWSEALRFFIRKAEDAGILVMVSGIVGSNTHRPLNPGEFRGFALADPLAPLIFINGADAKAAQMFTLAHEIAHLWLGKSVLSNSEARFNSEFRPEEKWCNAVAAEFLVPMEDLKRNLRKNEMLQDSMERMARSFKVSKLVILRRLFDAKQIDQETFDSAWAEETARAQRSEKQNQDKNEGGNFINSTLVRVGHRFAQALVTDTLEGRILYRDAFRMLGISKTGTFENIARNVRVIE